MTQTNAEVAPKLLEFLHELLPTTRIIGLLVNPSDPALADRQKKEFFSAAQTLAWSFMFSMPAPMVTSMLVFADLTQLRAGGLVIGTDPFFTSRSEQLAALAVRNAAAAHYKGREFAAAGGC